MSNIDYQILETELKKAFDCWIVRLKQKTDLASIYAIGLYTNGELSYLSPTANVNYREVDVSLRWSPPDWNYHLLGQECFEKAELELMKGWDHDYANFRVDKERLLSIIIELIKELRKQYFDKTPTVAGIFEGNMSSEIVLHSIRIINPEKVTDFFEIST